VAKHFKVSLRTVDNWRQWGLLPHVRIGRNVRFKLTEVDAAVRRGTQFRGPYR
jgi:excisionase family DNA binding protein